MVTASAAEPERACTTAGFYIRRLSADAKRDGHLTEGSPGVLRIEQCLRLSPDMVPMAVEHERGYPLDGLAPTGFTDAVITLGGVELPVVHEVA
jgi:hypothetical protein